MAAEVTTAGLQQSSAAQNHQNEEKENSKTNANGNVGGSVQLVGGTRVFKKTSPSGYITCYLGKRDFIDNLSHCDPIDGVVLVDPDRIGSDKVFVHVLAAFRYGREDLDVLGLTFRKDLFLHHVQVYPPLPETRRPLTKLQERLMKKLGPNAHAFYFTLPHSSPASVTLQPAQNDTGKPCGVDYELKAYAAISADDRPHKRNTIRLAIRKLIYAPPDAGPQPTAEQVKELSFPHSGIVRLEATLDRQKYYHGETISVNVLVDNNTSKPIKKYKVSIRQFADICLFSTAQYVCPVASIEGEDFIAANQSGWCKVYTLHPILSANRDKRGLALDGKLKHEETNLASSTILDNSVSKDNLGIIVSYKVKVKLYLAFGAGDIAVELPFILTHPLPASSTAAGSSLTNHATSAASSHRNGTSHDRIPCSSTSRSYNNNNASVPQPVRQGSLSLCENGADFQSAGAMGTSLPAVDHNLIQLEDDPDPVSVRLDDDGIFEDFARMRLQAHAARSGNGTTTAPLPAFASAAAPTTTATALNQPVSLFPTPVAMPQPAVPPSAPPPASFFSNVLAPTTVQMTSTSSAVPTPNSIASIAAAQQQAMLTGLSGGPAVLPGMPDFSASSASNNTTTTAAAAAVQSSPFFTPAISNNNNSNNNQFPSVNAPPFPTSGQPQPHGIAPPSTGALPTVATTIPPCFQTFGDSSA